ncbi:hypothetical protein O181_076464 [Austropuccinia psidii MF-1]|uniref:Uncharacterized protein n=1 Tax=Austropuccinia psidii MF-1 TaxID=1389203 RepID=A0A9Q3FD04_9BASI|nr:hypothetical protein [Austropuccinia psidii MF-1]
MHHFRKRFASLPSIIDYLQDLMEITKELNTRYHERQKEKNKSQEERTEVSKSSSSNPQNSSSSRHKMKKKYHFKKRDKPHSSLFNKDHKLMGSEKERILKEGFCAYCGGNDNIEDCVKRPQNQLTQPGKILSEVHVVFNGLNYFPPRAKL